MESIAFMGGIATVVVRLGVAMLIGCVLGINRDLREKPAGLRTHGLVALGSALVTLTSVQLANSGGTLDGSGVIRAVQGIIVGVGFLGGGVILRDPDFAEVKPRHHHKKVRGLTTAASIWVASALGIACGAGQWPSALVALAFTLLVLVAGGPVESRIHDMLHSRTHELDEPPSAAAPTSNSQADSHP